MKIIEKNEGTKISYTVTDTSICFADELAINLAKIQKDDPVHKDICFDGDGDLVIGTEAGKYYVAEIDVPAVTYIQEGEGEEEQQIPHPLNMDDVTLTLWNIKEKSKVQLMLNNKVCVDMEG
jgi:hypothetical protein